MRRFICLLLSLLLLFAFTVSAFASDEDLVSTPVFSGASATSYILMDGDTGAVLSSRNCDLPLPMASTTKIMTCVLALEEKSISDQVTVPKEAVGVEGSSVYLTSSETLSLEELLYALMLESANDAAVAIACHVSGSVDAFVEKMNEKAKEIGMKCTQFQNPHGLPADLHYSTARDLSILMKYALSNPVFCEMIETKTFSISAPEGKTRYLSNHNKLLRLYSDCIGGKTGYTKVAGRCLVSAAQRDGKKLICSTLGDPNDWKDHMSLFDYGFSLYSKKLISEVGDHCYTVSVVGGKSSEVKVTNTASFSVPLRAEEQIVCKVEVPKFVYAGISSGDEIGTVIFYRDKEEINRLPLVAEKSVSPREEKLSFWENLWQNFIIWLN